MWLGRENEVARTPPLDILNQIFSKRKKNFESRLFLFWKICQSVVFSTEYRERFHDGIYLFIQYGNQSAGFSSQNSQLFLSTENTVFSSVYAQAVFVRNLVSCFQYGKKSNFFSSEYSQAAVFKQNKFGCFLHGVKSVFL